MERIAFGKVPYRYRELAVRFQYAQDLAQSIDRRREKHDTKPAHCSIKCAGGKGKAIGECDFEMHVPKSGMTCGPKGTGNHFRGWIYSPYFAFRSDKLSDSQRRLARPSRYVQNFMARF